MKEEIIKLTKKELEEIKEEAFGVGYDAGLHFKNKTIKRKSLTWPKRNQKRI